MYVVSLGMCDPYIVLPDWVVVSLSLNVTIQCLTPTCILPAPTYEPCWRSNQLLALWRAWSSSLSPYRQEVRTLWYLPACFVSSCCWMHWGQIRKRPFYPSNDTWERTSGLPVQVLILPRSRGLQYGVDDIVYNKWVGHSPRTAVYTCIASWCITDLVVPMHNEWYKEGDENRNRPRADAGVSFR